MNLRVGIGIDAHRRVEGKQLYLGGVLIASDFGLLAHSDGDVISHAILDAMLGAASLGDKGVIFPDSDPQYKDIRSTMLLSKATALLGAKGYEVVNVDVSAMCEEPKLAPHTVAMKTELAAALGI